MTQKELLYIEDIYNHTNLIISLAKIHEKELSCEDYAITIKNSIKTHTVLLKKMKKLLIGVCNE